ncbi:MAG: rhomboid family intramembrane serine protease [Candidatus Thermoplasmatota archaeon]|nr:rhomboid family intramembrane serine protease [Candidatus Thermoplasmatota archaeon]
MEQRVPWATLAFLAAILATTALVTGLFPGEAELSPLWWSAQAMEEGAWWRLGTAMFAHAGPLHLVFNALALWSLRSLERELGTARMAGIYVASGIGGGLAHVLTSPVPTVGASGAIFGLLGVVLVLAPRMELSVLGFPMPAVVALALYASAVLTVPSFSELAPIAHWAHLGGLVTGMAGGVLHRPIQGLHHLAYVLVIFAASLVLVTSVSGLDLATLVDLYQARGLGAVLVETWVTWAALAAILAALAGLAVDEDVEPGEPGEA